MGIVLMVNILPDDNALDLDLADGIDLDVVCGIAVAILPSVFRNPEGPQRDGVVGPVDDLDSVVAAIKACVGGAVSGFKFDSHCFFLSPRIADRAA